MTLRIGYKASAEQFGPRELVEYAVRAEEVGLDSVVVSDHFLPWRHDGRARAVRAGLDRGGRGAHQRVQLGTSRADPDVPLQPGGDRAGVRHAWRCCTPDRVMLGVGTGEALNEIAVSGREWPEFKERFARLREAVRLMRELWTEDASFEGEYYRTVDATIYDKPEQPIPVYVAAGGPVVAKYAGRAGDGFICTSGKGMDLYTEKLMPAVAEGAQAAGRDPAEIDSMIEIKMSYDRDPRRGAGELPLLGAAVAHRRAEAQRRLRARDGAPRRRAADRAGREAVDRGVRPGRGRGADQALRRRGPQPPGRSTVPATTRSASSPSSPRTCCRSSGLGVSELAGHHREQQRSERGRRA